MRRPPAARLTLTRRVAAAALSLAAAGPALAQSPVPLGGEFRVNTTVAGGQGSPSVAVDIDGDMVVVWEGSGAVDDYGIFAQRYAASGAPVGAEFRVNTTTTGVQDSPSVAIDADGDCVVVWESGGQDGAGSGVYAQRYAASGVPVGGEFLVNTYTPNSQSDPSVAIDADGDFVVAWESQGQDGNLYGIYAQRYAASGAPVGPEFRVNTFTTSVQVSPSVAVDADGDFVVVWQGSGAGFGVYAQRYAASGGPVGAGFRVNMPTTGNPRSPYAAFDADGDMVVVWQSGGGQDGGQDGVYARRYEESGAPTGGEFLVNTYTPYSQSAPSVAVDADGDFVVVWQSFIQDGSGSGVYAQRYAASGAPAGGEFRVNTYTENAQQFPAVAMDAVGNFVVVWDSFGQDGAPQSGVYAQRYAAGPVTSEPGTTAGVTLALVPSPVGASGGRVRYEVPEAGRVRVSVSDVLGREVAVLVDGEQGAGPHSVALDVGRLAPGVYVVRLEAGASTVVRRVTVTR